MITFSTLSIELTRRCNMIPACSHCMRGDAQNIDLSNNDIDAILDQTDQILVLHFTGGEPFIAINKMQYVLDKIIQNKISLLCLYIVTNGLLASDDVINTIKQYSNYIKQCRAEYEKEYDTPYFRDIEIDVSTDTFHLGRNAETIISNYFILKRELDGFAGVEEIKTGDTPYNLGFAKHLPIGATRTYGPVKINNMQVAICDKDHIPECPVNTKLHKLISSNEKIVCCDIVLTATGNIVNQYVGDREYYTEDNPDNIICKADDDIWTALINYNKCKLNCYEWNNYQKRITNTDAYTLYHNLLYGIAHQRRNE